MSYGRHLVRPTAMTHVESPPSVLPGYVSKTDMVAALIRQLIITGELPAGRQLKQRDLAQRFHVSQTPVRETQRTLVTRGLAKGDTHRRHTLGATSTGPC